ncbi:MAG: 2-hydroxyacid dehydrogenase, partial [Burkholderiaceae bacterium]
QWIASDLSGKTVGLVGIGKIGSSFARMAAAFRMRVLAFDPLAQTRNPHVEFCDDLRAMLAQCDFVSIHCVLNPQTRHLISEAEFAAMKPTAFLINVSRGSIVDESALLRALQEKRIAGAALDVYSQEPLTKSGHPLSALYAMDNVILWPHLTFHTREAMQRLEDETIERAFEVLQGRPVLVRSRDPRLRSQRHRVRFADA